MKGKHTLKTGIFFRLTEFCLISVLLILSFAACGGFSAVPEVTDSKTAMADAADLGKAYSEPIIKYVPVLRNSLDSSETAELLFYDDMPNVPYISVEAFYDQFYLVKTDLTDGMTCSVDGNKYTLTNIAGNYAVFDIDADTIYTDSLEDFTYTAYTLQVLMSGGVDEDCPFVKEDITYDPEDPVPITLNLFEYGIDLRGDGTNVYAPLATVCDIFSTVETYHVVYSGKKIYTSDYSDTFVPTPALSSDPDYIADVKADHPADLADFTYRELCFNIDYFYGRPGQEWVHDDLQTMKIDELLSAKYPEIKEKLLSTDFKTFYEGLMHLIHGILFDGGHTTLMISDLFYEDLDLTVEILKQMKDLDYAQSFIEIVTTKVDDILICSETQNNAYGDDYYIERGDTAMIRFDYFVVDHDGWRAFYAGTGERPLNLIHDDMETYDTVGAVLSGLERAKKNPAIKNVIIDLTCNGGGENSAMSSIEWLMTGEGKMRFINILTGRSMTFNDHFDMNFDGKFDENDVSPYTDYNYGVLTGNYAFSCANSLPWFMHEHGAMILGQKSHGGTCSIRIASVAGVEFSCSAASNRIVSNSGESMDFGCPLDADLTVEGENPYANFFDMELLSEKMNEYFNAG